MSDALDRADIALDEAEAIATKLLNDLPTCSGAKIERDESFQERVREAIMSQYPGPGQIVTIAPGPAWDAESARIDEEIAADREEALSSGHVDALVRAEAAEAERDKFFAQYRQMTGERDLMMEMLARLQERLAGARLLAGDFTLEGATIFVNAERAAVNQMLERVRLTTA